MPFWALTSDVLFAYSVEEDFVLNIFGIPILELPSEPPLYSSEHCGIVVENADSGVTV